MHVGPDPYAKQRRWWPILLRMARQLYWTWWALNGLGLLAKSGPLSRWLERRFVEVEHGLRCLLIIKASGSKRFVPKADKSFNPETSEDVMEAEAPSKQTLGPSSGYRRVGFSLTLSGFDGVSQQHPPFAPFRGTSPEIRGRGNRDCRNAGELSGPVCGGVRSRSADADEKVWETFSRRRTPEGPGAASEGGTKAQSFVSPETDFAARLAAIESVFNDADGYAKRIARRVYTKGWRLIRLIAQQPTDHGFTINADWPQSVDAGPKPIPILDSS